MVRPSTPLLVPEHELDRTALVGVRAAQAVRSVRAAGVQKRLAPVTGPHIRLDLFPAHLARRGNPVEAVGEPEVLAVAEYYDRWELLAGAHGVGVLLDCLVVYCRPGLRAVAKPVEADRSNLAA